MVVLLVNFERDVVKSFNLFFDGKKGVAYRLRQSKYNDQTIDVLVDSPDYGYLCIECKTTSSDVLYFSRDFTKNTKNQKNQVENITNFIENSGRRGFLFVNFKNINSKKCYVMDWDLVYRIYINDIKSIKYNNFNRGSGSFVMNKIRGYYGVSELWKYIKVSDTKIS